MDTLKKSGGKSYGYLSRYSGVSIFYDTICDREVYGMIKDIKKDISCVTHWLATTDTLDYLALKYYNNPTYWWVIAMYNDIPDAFAPLTPRYAKLQIPNLASLSFVKER